jgi:hypothetical protein
VYSCTRHDYILDDHVGVGPTGFGDDHDVSVCLTVLLNPMMQIRDTLENVLDRSLVLTPSTCHLDLDRSELKLLSFRHAQNLEAVRRLPIIRNASGAGKGSN